MKRFLRSVGVFTLGLAFCFLGGCIKDADNTHPILLSDTTTPADSASPSKTAIASKYYYWVEKNGREGVVNERGQEVLPCEYSNVYIVDYDEIPAAILAVPADIKTSKQESMDYDLLLFDLNGNLIFKGKYNIAVPPYVYPICDGLIELFADKCGVISYKGEEVIPFRYDSIELYGDYILAVSGDYHNHPGKTVDVDIYDKKGSLQKSGKLKLAYSNTDPNLIIVADDTGEKRGLVDFSFKEVVSAEWDLLWYKGNGFYKAGDGDKYGLIDDQGKIVIPVKYNDVFTCNDSSDRASMLFSAEDEDGVYLFDSNGKQRFFSNKFIGIFDYNGIIITVDQSRKYHWINLEGEDIIPPAERIYVNESGLIVRENSEGCTYYTKDGVKLPFPKADRIEMISPQRFIFMTKDNRFYGICGADGSIIVPAEYDYLRPCDENNDLIIFRITDKAGITHGGIFGLDDARIVLDGFDSLSYAGGGLFYAWKGPDHGLVDINGNWIWQTSDYQTLMD